MRFAKLDLKQFEVIFVIPKVGPQSMQFMLLLFLATGFILISISVTQNFFNVNLT